MGLDRAWWLRLFSQRTQIQYPAPTWQLIIVCNSSSRGSNTFSLGSCTHLRHMNLHNHTYTLIKVKDFVFKAKHIKNLYLGLERCSVVKSACCFLVGPKRLYWSLQWQQAGEHGSESLYCIHKQQADWVSHRLLKP